MLPHRTNLTLRIALLSSLVIPVSAPRRIEAAEPSSAADLIRRAEELEQKLESDPKRVKLRHHSDNLIRLWQRAAERASGKQLAVAREGEARALKRLAKWSGIREDQERAKEAERALKKIATRAEPAPAAHSTKAKEKEKDRERESDQPKDSKLAVGSGAHRLRGTSIEVEGESFSVVLDLEHAVRAERSVIAETKKTGARVIFDISPAVADRSALRTQPIEHVAIERLRVGQFDGDTVRVVLDVQHRKPMPPEVTFDPGTPPRIVVGRRPLHAARVTDEQEVEARESDALSLALRRALDTPASPSSADGAIDGDGAQPAAPAPTPAAATPSAAPPAVDQPPSPELSAAAPAAPEADAARGFTPVRTSSVSLAERRVPPPPPEPAFNLDALLDKIRSREPDAIIEPRRRPEPLIAPPPAPEGAPKNWLTRIRRVVIDAGHGGKDTGAIGRRGIREKDVNLAIALRVGKELEQKLGVEVVYTRKTDVYLSLGRRVEIAHGAEADLFISVHSNAHRDRDTHGIETYYLNTTSNRYSARLAARENAEQFDPDSLGHEPVPESVPEEDTSAESLPSGALGRDLRLLLADLAMRSATDDSRRLARYVQSSLIGTLRRQHAGVRDLGVKHALFYVLLGVRMPSILIESGFVTHRDEEKRLADPSYQSSIATAITTAVRRFVEERHQVASARN